MLTCKMKPVSPYAPTQTTSAYGETGMISAR